MNELRLLVRLNSNIKMTRGKAAAQAIHAALLLLRAHPGTPVIVLGGKPSEIEVMPAQIRDAGRTELEPGTLTAGADWSWSEGLPPARTMDEKKAFERAWDERVEAGWARNGKPAPEPNMPGKQYPPSIIGSRRPKEDQ
jgi:PTH2 family peptidyl-tRNA hydrolase